jgi:hypothetical protein
LHSQADQDKAGQEYNGQIQGSTARVNRPTLDALSHRFRQSFNGPQARTIRPDGPRCKNCQKDPNREGELILKMSKTVLGLLRTLNIKPSADREKACDR